jgi:glyoxylase-like metal-dependent hydrolase (beta-lactamase superfamily II)
MQLAPSLHRVGSDIVAFYLISDERGVTMVDAGLPGQWKDLLRELTAMGKTPTDIQSIILTHGDSDHIGIAERLRREYSVPVYVHSADAARARGEESSHPKWGKINIAALLRFLGYTLRKGGMRTTYLGEVIPVADGDVLDLPGDPQIVGLPGHSPGSIGVYVPAVDAVFVGDALTTRHVLTGARGPQPAPFTDDPKRAEQSLTSLAAIPARWVLVGHGTVWNQGARAIVEAIRSRPNT